MRRTRSGSVGSIDASLLLLIVIALLVGIGIVITVHVLRPDPIEAILAGDKTINTLFVIENEGKPLCSYVLLFNPATRRAAVFDIPGSLGLILQQINRVDRIDAVYDPRRITPFRNEIERLLGLDITFSVVISLENLGKITDLIRGVEVFISSPVNEYVYGHILFPSGIVRLDGDKARVFITYELPDESFELVNFRRQRFFMSFLRQIGEKNEFLQHPQAARMFYSFVRTSINQRALMRLFTEFARIDIDRVSVSSVGGNVREVSGQPLIFPHGDGSLIREIVRQRVTSLTRPMESFEGDRVFTVEILNGTTVTGLAARTAELFRGFGYNVISVGNADRNDHDRTIIIDRSGYHEMARAFGEIIRCRNIYFDPLGLIEAEMGFNIHNFEFRSDFTLILGRDFNGRYVTQ